MSTATMDRALVGRDGELTQLTELIAAVVAGHGSSVLIEGEPGIGKSSLMRSVTAEAVGLGCQVFWGAGDELGQALPLLPWLDALRVREPSADTRRTTILRLLRGELAAERSADISAALGEQILALVAEHSAAGPTVLVIDDLQWGDEATVTLWARLARSAARMPLMLVGAMRPVPQREDVVALRRAAPDMVRMQLTGLNEAATADLLTSLAGARPSAKLLRLAAGAAGNPLYVTELLAALDRSHGLAISEAGAAEVTSGSAPGSLSAAIADRLGFVSGQVREVVRAAALLGVDFAVPDLATVLGRGVPDLVLPLNEARAAGILTETGRGLGFRHPLIRAALYDEMPRSLRAAWHRDAARALAAAGAPVDRVARQLLWAVGGSDGPSDPLDAWMLTWLTGAAAVLIGQAPQVAVDLLRQAVATNADDQRHDLLVARLADALFRVGNAEESEQIARRVLARTNDPDLLVDLHWIIGQGLLLRGRSAEAVAMFNEALASPMISSGHRARLLVLITITQSSLGEIDRAKEHAAAALAAASEAGDAWAIGWALHTLTLITAVQGNVAAALPLFERALAVTETDPSLTDLRILLQINQAVMLGDLDRYPEALAAARQARRLAEQAGTLIRLAQAHSALGQLYFETGQWDDALAELRAVPEDLKEPACACADLGAAAVIGFHRGDASSARQYLDAARPHADRLGSRVIPPLAQARSLDHEQMGAPQAALVVLTTVFANNAAELEEIEDLLADAVRLAAETGDVRTAGELAGRAEAIAGQSDVPRRHANALMCRGLVDRDPARLLTAAEQYEGATRPLLSAQAYEAAADGFASFGVRDQARAAFTRALELYGALGAGADAARLKAKFRAYGIRRGPQAKHRHARSGWESLTPTETTIAALVQSGLSNPDIAARLFLSRRTVATHVSHILKKLNVQSRTDIAREAALRTIRPR